MDVVSTLPATRRKFLMSSRCLQHGSLMVHGPLWGASLHGVIFPFFLQVKGRSHGFSARCSLWDWSTPNVHVQLHSIRQDPALLCLHHSMIGLRYCSFVLLIIESKFQCCIGTEWRRARPNCCTKAAHPFLHHGYVAVNRAFPNSHPSRCISLSL